MASLSKTKRNGRNYFRCQFFTNGKRHAVYLGSIKESAGMMTCNPFAELKAGSDSNPDGKHIVPISDYEKLINACTDSDWRTIIALARLGGLRCPSELTNFKWPDVNWDARTIRITSPKTKRHGKTERTFPLFGRLDQALSDHWELTGHRSEYVITQEHLRRSGVSLSERFNDIRKLSGVPRFDNPFRNMRVSAVNDVCRIPGITPKTISDWFGNDQKTALKYYNQVTRNDFDQALSVDPFIDSVIANRLNDAQDDAGTPKHDAARQSRNEKTPRNNRFPELDTAKSYPTRTRT